MLCICIFLLFDLSHRVLHTSQIVRSSFYVSIHIFFTIIALAEASSNQPLSSISSGSCSKIMPVIIHKNFHSMHDCHNEPSGAIDLPCRYTRGSITDTAKLILHRSAKRGIINRYRIQGPYIRSSISNIFSTEIIEFQNIFRF